MEVPTTPGPEPRAVDGALLEIHKENIVPSRDGRSAAAISSLYSVPRTQRNKDLATTHAHYRQLISSITPTDILDGDPLDLYCQYVNWIMDNYPSGSSTESGLLAALEEGTRKFCASSLYKNDRRYVRLWMEYATLVEQSERVYAFMLANDIGSIWPHPYEEFALILERNRNYSKADGIYRLAIHRRIAGYEDIKLRYREFQARCASAGSSTDPTPVAPPASTRPPLGGRIILGSRAPSGQQRTQQQQQQMRTPSVSSRSNAGKVAVFVDSGDVQNDVETNDWPQLATRAEGNKENSKANKADGTLLQKLVPPRTPKVTIFRDETSTPSASSLKHTTDSPEQVFRPSHTTEAHHELSRDPLRNYGSDFAFNIEIPAVLNFDTGQTPANATTIVPLVAAAPTLESMIPSQPSATQTVTSINYLPSTSNSNSTRMPSAVGSKPVPTLPKAAPGKRPEIAAFEIDAFYHHDDEWTRVEIKARAMGMLNKKWSLPPVEGDDEVVTQAPRIDLQVPLKDDSAQSRQPRKSRARQSRLGGGSPTTNTKAALSDVFDMFNETVRVSGDDTFNEDEEEVEEIEPQTQAVDTANPALSAAKNVRWTPLADKTSSGTPLPLRGAPLGDKTSFVAPPTSSNITVLGDKTPSAAPRSAIPLGNATPSTAGPTPGKFAVFQENGERRLPSIATTAGSGVTSSFGAVARENIPNLAGCNPITIELSSQVPCYVSHLAVSNPQENVGYDGLFAPKVPSTSALSLIQGDDEEGFDDIPSTAPPRPLVFKDIAPAAIQGSIDHGSLRSSGDVFGGNEQSQFLPEKYEETKPEDSYTEDQYDLEELHPREYATRGGVAIMTPITERTLEYESRISLAASRRSTVLDDSPEGVNTGAILDGLNDANSLSPMLGLARRASVIPRISTIGEPPEEAETLYAHDQLPPINPFEPDNVEGAVNVMLSRTDIDYSLYRDMQTVQSTHLKTFTSHTERTARLSKSGSSGPVKSMPFQIGDAEYAMLAKLGEGGFGAVFLAEDLTVKELIEEDDEGHFAPGDELVAVKAVRPSMRYEFAVLHALRASLPPDAIRSIISPREFYHFSNESLFVMEYSRYGTLLDVVNRAVQMGVNATDSSGIDELLIIFFTIELLRLVQDIHESRFIHGDLKIDNCLLRLPNHALAPLSTGYNPLGYDGWSEHGVKLIDFGRTINVNLYERDQMFVGNWPTDARDCVEMREGRPWTYQTDYAGLAGIVYCMMFGKYIETTVGSTSSDGTRRFKIATPLKRYWQTEIWAKFYDVLLNPAQAQHDEELRITDELKWLEEDMTAWLMANCEKRGKSLKRMLTQMYQFTASRSWSAQT